MSKVEVKIDFLTNIIIYAYALTVSLIISLFLFFRLPLIAPIINPN